MTALYLIAAEYRAAATALADLDMDAQTVADTLDGMAGDLEVKAQSVAFMVRSMEADAAAVKQWAKDAAERAKAIEARADSLREYLSRTLQECGITSVKGPGITLSFRASHAVVIDEPGLIPAAYMRTPEPPPAVPDKRAIADAIKLGEAVPGAHMETRQSLQVK